VPGRLRPRRFLAIEGLLKYPTVYVSEDRVSESDAWSRPGEQPADATDAAEFRDMTRGRYGSIRCLPERARGFLI